MIALDDVPRWLIVSGIGHVVCTASGGWNTTACNHLITGGAVSSRPSRICRECRKALRDLKRAEEVAGE
jgi:hypothetical protein